MRVSFRKGLAAGVALVCALASAHAQQTNFWNVNAAAQWTNTANWVDVGFYPDGIGDVADFTAVDITGNRNITIAGDGVIVGTLRMSDGSHRYQFNLGTGGSLTFDDTDGLAEIDVVNGPSVDSRKFIINFGFQINDDLLLRHQEAGVFPSLRIVGAVTEGSAGRNVTKAGPGLVILENDWQHSGNTLIEGGEIGLSTVAGVLSATTNITLENATLTLANDTASGGTVGFNTNRINDAATFTSLGGTVGFLHAGGPATNYAETIGALSLLSGNLLIGASQAAVGQTSLVSFVSYAHSGSATLRLEGPGLNVDERNEVVFNSANLAHVGGVIPYALIKDATNGTSADYNLATTNVATDGVSTRIVAMTTYEQSVDQADWAAGENVRPTNDVTMTGGSSLGSLVLDDGIDLLGPAADRTLTFSGADSAAVVAQLGAGTNTIDNNGTFEHILTFGNNQAIFQVVGTLIYNATNTGEAMRGTNGFIKAGPGTLILNSTGDASPDGANDMTGNFHINEGTLELQRNTAAGSTVLNLDGGNLDLINNANTAFNRDVLVNDDGTITLGRLNQDGGITHTLGDFTIAAGKTLNVRRRALTGTNPGYTLAADDVQLLGSATISVQEGAGSGNGNFDTDKIVGTNAPNQNLTVSGIGGVNDAFMFVAEDLLLTGDLLVDGITLRAIDAGTNVQGNIKLDGGVFSVGNNFARELGTGDGQVQLTGGSGFSARGAPVSVRIEDGGGGLTNLVWGMTNFSIGTLYLNNSDGNNQLTFENNLDFNVAGTANRQITVDSNTAIMIGALTNSGGGLVSFTKEGGGTLSLEGPAVEWNGRTAINGGVLRVTNVNVLSTSLANSNLVIAGANEIGALETTGTLTNGLGDGQGQVSVVGGGNGTQNHRNGFSAYGGDFTIDLGGDGTGTGPQLQWNSTFFDPNGGSTNDGALLLNTADANGTLRFLNEMDLNGEANLNPAGAPARNFGVLGSVAVVSGDLTNSQAGTFPVGLRKRGAGILALEGFNTYDGITEIAAGTLLVNGTQTGGGAFSVIGSATLGGTGLISAPVWVTNGATVAPGSLGIGNLTVQGDVDIEGILSIEIDAASAGFVDLLTVTGILDISAATLNFVTNGITLDDTAYIFASYGTLVTNDPTAGFGAVNFLPDGYQLDYNYLGGNQIALVIPEPTTWALLLLGGLALLAAWRRR